MHVYTSRGTYPQIPDVRGGRISENDREIEISSPTRPNKVTIRGRQLSSNQDVTVILSREEVRDLAVRMGLIR